VPASGLCSSNDSILNRANGFLAKGKNASFLDASHSDERSIQELQKNKRFFGNPIQNLELQELRELQTENQQLKEALQQQQRAHEEVHEHHINLNTAFQEQCEYIQHMKEEMEELKTREAMLRDQHNKLQAEHQLFTSQFHIGEVASTVATPDARARPQATFESLQAFLNNSDSDSDDSFRAPCAAPKAAVVVARSKDEPKLSLPTHLLDDCSCLPREFFCPITWDVMTDPVVAVDGHTYELEAILQWLNQGHKTSPMTKEQLQSFLLVPNRSLRAQIIAANDSRVSKSESLD